MLLRYRKLTEFDVTIFQTPEAGGKKGYRQVYRCHVNAKNHREVLDKTFSLFNVADTLPNDYQSRFISTGDILLIDEGRKGQTYYKLFSDGWKPINRILVR
ncbi:YodL domain-containing protein [Metabacillus sp. GX 13764]|uniref:YodL domain-containing protein n=1 Tax=Metabacillus kandeliae TaxID=2900151 RepID=UPI001E5B075B|nr:YodL domain-containing protein [Metabacillus kandeliae]MCD7033497.1 YodL domain-containing protein [Metabacillus kandeliae]